MNYQKSDAQLVAWMTCDDCYVDPATGKSSLMGIFTILRAKSFPVVHPSMVWYVCLSDVSEGVHSLKISICPSSLIYEYDLTKDLNDSRGSWETIIDKEFTSEGKHKKIGIINKIKRLKFEEPDEYSIQIEIDDDVLYVDSFIVKATDSFPNEKNI